MYSLDMLDKGMSHVPHGTEWDATKFHHTKNGAQLHFNDFWNFPFNIFRPQLKKPQKSKLDKRGTTALSFQSTFFTSL